MENAKVMAYTPNGRVIWENISDIYRDSPTSMRFRDENGNYIHLINMPIVYMAAKSDEDSAHD